MTTHVGLHEDKATKSVTCLLFLQGEKGFKGDPGTPGQNGAKVL